MDGILLVDKPKGWTSFDVVAKVRGVLKLEAQNMKPLLKSIIHNLPSKKPKVGHTGTLDPLATGLLILCIGSYCKRAQEFSKLDKVYEVEMRLGMTSTTDDEEGEKTAVSQKQKAKREVEEALQGFVGEIMQTPPAFSAIKVNGKRAYKLARAGQEVKIEPRPVTIYEIRNTKYDYPFVRFTAHVSSGTYIRSLVRDIGQKLGTGAYMSNLRRTSVGQWRLTDAVNVEELSAQNIAKNLLKV